MSLRPISGVFLFIYVFLYIRGVVRCKLRCDIIRWSYRNTTKTKQKINLIYLIRLTWFSHHSQYFRSLIKISITSYPQLARRCEIWTATWRRGLCGNYWRMWTLVSRQETKTHWYLPEILRSYKRYFQIGSDCLGMHASFTRMGRYLETTLCGKWSHDLFFVRKVNIIRIFVRNARHTNLQRCARSCCLYWKVAESCWVQCWHKIKHLSCNIMWFRKLIGVIGEYSHYLLLNFFGVFWVCEWEIICCA